MNILLLAGNEIGNKVLSNYSREEEPEIQKL